MGRAYPLLTLAALSAQMSAVTARSAERMRARDAGQRPSSAWPSLQAVQAAMPDEAIAYAASVKASSIQSAWPQRPARIATGSFTSSLQLVGFDGGGWVTGGVAHESSGILYVRTDVGGAYSSLDGGKSWSWISGHIQLPNSWGAQGIATNQSDPSGLTVYLGVYSGLWRSLDGGNTFTQVLANVSFPANSPWRGASECIVIDDARPWRMWAAPQQGLYRSEDGGDTWSQITSFTTDIGYNASDKNNGLALVSLVQNPSDPTLANHVVVGSTAHHLAVSTDDGVSWTQITAPPSNTTTWATPWRVVRLPNGTSYVGSDVHHNGNTDSFLYRLTASNWSDVSTYNFTNITPKGQTQYAVRTVESMYNDTTIVACWTDGYSCFVSRDGGETFEGRNTSMTGTQPVWWYPGDTQIPYGRNRILTSNRNPGVWVITSGFGVLTSSDEGNNWGFSSDGIGEVCMIGCWSHPTVPNMTFCGAEDLTGFIISDGGYSGKSSAAVFPYEPKYWTVDFGHGVAWTNTSGEVGLAIAGDEQGDGSGGQWIVWPSLNSTINYTNCLNMTGMKKYMQFIDQLQSPDDPTDVLLAMGWGWYGPFNTSNISTWSGGLMRSRDTGASWDYVTRQPLSGFVGNTWTQFNQLVLDGGDVNTRWWSLCNIGIFVSRDRGETWNQTVAWPYEPGITDIISSLAPDAVGGAGHMYVIVGSYNGRSLKHTSDFGATWTVVGNFSVTYVYGVIPLMRVATHPSGRIAITAMAPGDTLVQVYVSIDNGGTWQSVTVPEQGDYISGIVGLTWDTFDPTVLYMATGGHSVVVLHLSA